MIRSYSLRRALTLRRTLHVVGGLLVFAVVAALPASLGLISPDALGAHGFAGDPSAAALRSLDQTLQGHHSLGVHTAILNGMPCAAFATLPEALVAIHATGRRDAVSTPLDERTALLL